MGCIFVVEDDKATLRLLETLLHRMGHRVLTASSVVAALALMESEDPDLILLDSILPDQQNYELARQVRAEGKTMPIIAMSVGFGADDAGEALEAGCDYFLTKPFKIEDFHGLVGKILA